jgi:putative hydrolase of the HAD superfamily
MSTSTRDKASSLAAVPEQRVVVFDLGGVLVESAGRVALMGLMPQLHDEKRVLDRWLRSPAVGLFERGRITPLQFASAFADEWGMQIPPSEFLVAFAAWLRGLYPGASALVQALRAHHRVGCLSNTNAVHWARLTDAQAMFDFCFASHLTGHMKPDREAYEHALRHLDSPPENVYFFDDLEPNVVAARKLGINAFHVNGVAEATAAARTAGLLYSGCT